jgi:SAM-dependent methyltransferase
MDVNYWNNFAHEYDQLVIDAFTYGRANTIAKQIEQFASRDRDVGDFGCGPGKLLPLLSKKFNRVYGYDFSDKLLDIAKERCQGLSNVEIVCADLSQPVRHLPLVDLAICLNAAIMPDTEQRMAFLKGLTSRIKPGGTLILNVPSMESLLYSASREAEWRRKIDLPPSEVEELTYTNCLTGPKLMAQGILLRGGEPTKHYLKEELIILVGQAMRLDLIEILKMEYDWKTELEIDSAPRGMRGPHPWDWLVIANARGNTAGL